MPHITPDQATDLPATLDELIAALESGHATDEGLVPLSYAFAEALESLRHCDVCHRPILDAEVMATTLAEHYGVGTDERQAIEDALRSSELETGDTLSPNYCSFHAQITSE